MAEILISRLIDLVWFFDEDVFSLIQGFAGDVEMLKRNLSEVKSVVRHAKQRQFLDQSMRRWVAELEDTCYDMDNVFDEWRTVLLKSKQQQEDGKFSKVRFLILSCFGVVQFRRLSLIREIILKIIEMNKRLDEIGYQKQNYVFERKVIEEEGRMATFSTPLVDESESAIFIYGRNEEKDSLLEKLLLLEGPQNISIVGMGGLGKTTLAKLAYNDDAVQEHFEERIWVHTGYPFHLKKIPTAIIESITGSCPDFVALDTLLTYQRKCIQGKRFLIVLDDVWVDDWTQWELLLATLNNGAIGSKVLVTTRDEKVAAVMRAPTNLLALRSLSDEHCWLLFSGLAFLERCREEREQLEAIGKKIVSKCRGLPLVAKTLGIHMRFKRSKQEWLDVLHNKLWELDDDVTHTVFAPLLLSCYDLPSLARHCLLYCSIFPEDHKIDKEDLIDLWMSQGYLDADNKFEMGEECFKSLAKGLFFQNFENKFCGEITTFKMHGVIHDLVQFAMRNNCFIWDIYGDDENEGTNQEKETIRHFTLLLRSGGQIPISVFNKKKLRTLFVTRSETSKALNLNLLPKVSSLRTVCFTRCGIEVLPGGIGDLLHLRYLNLSYNSKLKELPYGLCKLFNLQTLRLNGCTALRSLPEKIGKLVNLQHLYINDCNQLEKLPIGIGRLAFLRKLDMFIVPLNYLDNKAMKLGDLSKLKDFQGCLCIHGIGDVEDAGDARKAELKKRQDLADLKLIFSQRTRQRRTEAELKLLLEALQPHPNLISLEIREYHGATFPSWLTLLINLRKLAVNGFPNCGILPPFGRLPSLEILHIEDIGKVEKVGLEFLGLESGSDEMEIVNVSITSFPMLKELRFRGLNSWNHWSGIEYSISSLRIMPSLRLLEISNCPSLETLPDYVQKIPVQNLTINRCPILEKCCQERGMVQNLLHSKYPN